MIITFNNTANDSYTDYGINGSYTESGFILNVYDGTNLYTIDPTLDPGLPSSDSTDYMYIEYGSPNSIRLSNSEVFTLNSFDAANLYANVGTLVVTGFVNNVEAYSVVLNTLGSNAWDTYTFSEWHNLNKVEIVASNNFVGFDNFNVTVESVFILVNSLKKSYSSTTVQPNSYQQWIPGYSYFKDSSEARLTSSGKAYVAARLGILGYKVTAANVESFIFAMGYGISDWVIAFGFVPLLIGGYGAPAQMHIAVDSYFDTPSTGTIVNASGSYTTVIPEPYEQQAPIIGWNAGAISVDMFTSTGTSSFSVETNSVGVFTGLCEQSIAVQDQRFERIKYAIYTHLGIGSVYIDNIKKTVDFSYTRDDVFKIVISKYLISFYMNGLLLYSETKEDNNNNIYVLDCSMYYSNDTILNASINSLGVLDSYSSGVGLMFYTGQGTSLNHSIGTGSYTYIGIGSNLCEVEFIQEYVGSGISSNYSIGIGLQEYTGQGINYPSRMDALMTYTGFGISKNHSIGQGTISYSGLGEAGGIVPTIPPIGLGYMEYMGFSRNVFILPPQVFIIT
jgi:hypothetical protein